MGSLLIKDCEEWGNLILELAENRIMGNFDM